MQKSKINFSTTIKDKKNLFKKSKKDLYKILNEAIIDLNDKVNVSLNIRTNNEIKELNIRYRNVNSSTDVLSFPLNEKAEKIIDLGDIFINGEILDEQAKSINSNELTELKFLFMHGLLHLLGYDHIEEDDKEKMMKRQKEIFIKTKIRDNH